MKKIMDSHLFFLKTCCQMLLFYFREQVERRWIKINYRFYLVFIVAICVFYFTYNYMHGHYSDIYNFAKKYSQLNNGMSSDQIELIYPRENTRWKNFKEKEGKNILVIFPVQYTEINQPLINEMSDTIDSTADLRNLSKAIIIILNDKDEVENYGWSDTIKWILKNENRAFFLTGDAGGSTLLYWDGKRLRIINIPQRKRWGTRLFYPVNP